MKTIYTKQILSQLKCSVFTLMLTSASMNVNGQAVSTFEDISLPADSFYNGSDLAGGFQSGDAFFVNKYDTAWGGYWAGGFAISNMTDTTTAGYTNSFSAITGKGYANSANYAVANAFMPVTVRLTGTAQNTMVKGTYITNTTFAALSMRDGDTFAKKFGGVTGTDPDFFLLTIKGFTGDTLTADSVNFYLADYRFADSTQDYIVKTWGWVDLTSLGNVDSLSFSLSSSDVGMFGMNTPSYFAMDNFNSVAPLAVDENDVIDNLKIYPNPVSGILNINLNVTSNSKVIITDITGKIVYERNCSGLQKLLIPVTNMSKGVYLVTVKYDNEVKMSKFIKQ